MADPTFDGDAKTITLGAGVTSIDVEGEIYSAWKRWVRNSDGSKYDEAFDNSFGGNDVGGGKFVGAYFILRNDLGWRIIPDATNHELEVVGNLYPSAPLLDMFTMPGTYTIPIYLERSVNAQDIGLTDAAERLNYSGNVWIDTVGGSAGTAYPIGTVGNPVSNLADALTIASTFGANTLKLESDLTVDADISGFTVDAPGNNTTVTLSAGNDVTGCYFSNVTITGAASTTGDWEAKECVLNTGLTGVRGRYYTCAVDDAITLSNDTLFVDCYSYVPGSGAAEVSGNNVGNLLVQFRRFTGGLQLSSFVSTDTVSVDLLPGRLELLASITGGTFKVRGAGEPVVDNSTGTTVDADGFGVWDQILRSPDTAGDLLVRIERLLRNKEITSPSTGIATLYDDAGTGTLLTRQMYEGTGTGQTYRGDGAERRERYE